MAVNADHRLADIGHIFENTCNQSAELFGDGIPDGIRDVNGRRAAFDHFFDYFVQICRVGATGIHRGKLDVIHHFLPPGYHTAG